MSHVAYFGTTLSCLEAIEGYPLALAEMVAEPVVMLESILKLQLPPLVIEHVFVFSDAMAELLVATDTVALADEVVSLKESVPVVLLPMVKESLASVRIILLTGVTPTVIVSVCVL